MGNLQANEAKNAQKSGKTPGKVKSLMKIRAKRTNKTEFTGIVPEECALLESKQKSQEEEKNDHVIVSDSWCKVNKVLNEDLEKTSAVSSSSGGSNFTDPMVFSTPINECSEETNNSINDIEIPNTQEDFLHNLTLNSFKLNEYRARHEEHEEKKSKKLSKLGVSKTSQISLDSDPKECFVTDNVVICKNEDNEEADEDVSVDEGTLKRNNQVAHLVKRISDVSLSKGKFCLLVIFWMDT